VQIQFCELVSNSWVWFSQELEAHLVGCCVLTVHF